MYKSSKIAITLLVVLLTLPMISNAEVDLHDSNAIRKLRQRLPYLNMEWRIKVEIEGQRETGYWYNDTQRIMGTDLVVFEIKFSLESLDTEAPMARDVQRHRGTGRFIIQHPGFDIPYSETSSHGVRCEGYNSGTNTFTIEILGGISEPQNGFDRDAGLYWFWFDHSDVGSRYSNMYYDIEPYCELPYGCANFNVDCVYLYSNHTTLIQDKRLTGALLQWLSTKLPLVPGQYVDRQSETDKGIVVRYTLSTVGPECPNLCKDLSPCTLDRCEQGTGCVNDPQNGNFDFDPHDCYKNECHNGYSAYIPDDTEEPLQEVPDRPCVKQICTGGSVVEVADIYDIPPQEPNNCSKEICDQYGIKYEHDPTDVIQDSPHDCTREVCQTTTSVIPISIPDDSETPIQIPENGFIEICRGGRVVLVPE